MLIIEDLTGAKELDGKAMARIQGGNPLVPVAAAAVGIGLVAVGGYLVYKGGKNRGLW